MRSLKTMIIKAVCAACVLPALLCVQSCDQGGDSSRRSDSFMLTCMLGDGIKGSAAKLYVYYPAYGRLCLQDSACFDRGVFSFSGSIDGPQVGVIEFDNKSIAAVKLVLEPGTSAVRLYRHRIVFEGGRQNVQYAEFLNARNSAVRQHCELWHEYARALADSTLTRKTDASIAGRDSVLQDSVQNLIVTGINRGEAFSQIIRDRYLNELDSVHLARLTTAANPKAKAK